MGLLSVNFEPSSLEVRRGRGRLRVEPWGRRSAGRTFRVGEVNPASLSGTVGVPGVPGVYMKTGVILNDAMRGFLKGLREKVGFDIVVTSGIRTASEQASAMLSKIQRGENLYNLYANKGLLDEIMSAGKSVGSMASVIQGQVARGSYLSRHLRGDALDIRLASPSENDAVANAAQGLGAEVVRESDHIHIEELGSGFAKLLNVAQDYWPLYIAGSAAIGLVILAFAWRKRTA